MGTYQLIGFLYIIIIGECPVLESPQMIEGVIAHLMTFGHDTSVEVMIAEHILAHHEEGGLHAIVGECLQDEGGGF